MSFPIKFLSLQKSELEYEVSIRGSTPGATVQELRKQIAKLGPLFPSEDILESFLEPEDDLKGVVETLNKVKSYLESDLDRNTVLRTENYLNHLYHRINRIIVDDDNKKQLDNCISQYRSYSELFKSVQDKGTDLLISPGCTESTSSTPPMNITVTCDRGSSTDLGRLKYDGKSCVRSFIQRFTEFCDARSISEAKALSFATEVFTGDALHWYRSVKDRISNWSELINLLRQDFDQLDYDYRLLSEIRARTQGESENITIYLSIMSGLFSRLARTLTDDDKLEIILHNIRPCYASTLASANEIKSLDSLQALCRNYETIQARLANFHEPSAATPNTLAPEFAYNGNKSRFGNKIIPNKQNLNPNNYSKFNNKNNNNYSNNYTNKTNSNQTHHYVHAVEAPKARYCPRCRVNTHNFRQCTESKDIIFCFKCGRPDTKTPQCPDCNKDNLSNSKN